MDKHTISFAIITFNEEKNIKKCLDSIKWSNDIAILDSYSTDSTIDICKKYDNVNLYFRKFDNYADQRNWLLDNHNFKNEWIFIIDADESIGKDLKLELLDICKSNNIKESGFAVKFNFYFFGKLINHACELFYITRFFKNGKGKFETQINEKLLIDGEVGYLANRLDHENLNGLSSYIAKHNNYSSKEAKVFLEKIKNHDVKLLENLFTFNKVKQAKFLKNIIILLPFKGLIMFFYLYIIKRGFLDGKEGLIFCLLKAFYFFMIEIKMFELNKRKIQEDQL